jgi:hypothetical protein
MTNQIDYTHRFAVDDNVMCETITGKKFSGVVVATLVLDEYGYPGYRVRSLEDKTMEIDVGQIQVTSMAMTSKKTVVMDRQYGKTTFLRLIKGDSK